MLLNYYENISFFFSCRFFFSFHVALVKKKNPPLSKSAYLPPQNDKFASYLLHLACVYTLQNRSSDRKRLNIAAHSEWMHLTWQLQNRCLLCVEPAGANWLSADTFPSLSLQSICTLHYKWHLLNFCCIFSRLADCSVSLISGGGKGRAPVT